jgi:tetratricopeptide (TPR) repeat protein
MENDKIITMKKLILAIGLCIISVCALTGQDNDLQNALTNYQTLKYYDQAIPYFSKYLKNNPKDTEHRAMLADCYRLCNKLKEAEAEYYAAFRDNANLPAIHLLRYGQVLKSIGRFKEARTYFQLYERVEPKLGKHQVKSCDFASENAAKPSNEWNLIIEQVNTIHADFAPTFYKDMLVFGSFRKANTKDRLNTRLYTAEISPSGKLSLLNVVKTRFEAGEPSPAMFDKKYDQVAVTEHSYRDGVRMIPDAEASLTLLLGEINALDDWAELISYPYNSFGGSTGQACFSPDGKAVYFTSNSANGYGGFDLYVSRKVAGAWTLPENLGPEVNTPGNEMTPYLTAKTLYFSSDYHYGLGGMDMFSAKLVNEKWTQVKNLGAPINSPYDDFYMIMNEAETRGYITSNRPGGLGAEDIYRIERNPNAISQAIDVPKSYENVKSAAPATVDKTKVVTNAKPPTATTPAPVKSATSKQYIGVILDEKTNLPLADVMVKTAGAEAISNKKGEYTLMLEPDVYYTISFSKAGYKVLNQNVQAKVGQANLGTFKMASVYPSGDFTIKGDVPDAELSTDMPATVYKIQLGKFANPAPGLFDPLKPLGNLVEENQGTFTLYSLGYYAERSQTDVALGKVKKSFGDAFVKPVDMTTLKLNEKLKIAPLIIYPSNKTPAPAVPKPAAETAPVASSYKNDYTVKGSGGGVGTGPSGSPNKTTGNKPDYVPAILQSNTKEKTSPAPVKVEEALALPPAQAESPVAEEAITEVIDVKKADVAPVFRIQLGAYKDPSIARFKDLESIGKIEAITDSKGVTVFYLGSYTKLADARKALDKTTAIKGSGPFIVAFKGDKKITLSEALQ